MTIHAVLFARAELRGGGACPRGTEVSAQGPGGCVRCPQTCRLLRLFCRRSIHGQGGLRHQTDQGGLRHQADQGGLRRQADQGDLHVQETSVRQSRQETGGPCSQSPGHRPKGQAPGRQSDHPSQAEPREGPRHQLPLQPPALVAVEAGGCTGGSGSEERRVAAFPARCGACEGRGCAGGRGRRARAGHRAVRGRSADPARGTPSRGVVSRAVRLLSQSPVALPSPRLAQRARAATPCHAQWVPRVGEVGQGQPTSE